MHHLNNLIFNSMAKNQTDFYKTKDLAEAAMLTVKNKS